ncbi:pseudouridine synthase [Meredithblackwellia eburnea MCA 4105]
MRSTASRLKQLLEILYEDSMVLVINKPSGVAMQGQWGTTAREGWEKLLTEMKQRPESPVVFPTHRLDKGTTGALLLAKTQPAARQMSKQFKTSQVTKTYLALVHGAIKVGYKGAVTNPVKVKEDAVSCLEEGSEDGAKATTEWECLARGNAHSLLNLAPSTGRKHQLRVHLAQALQAPIVGDFKYAPNAPHSKTPGLRPNEILLHATSLGFHNWDKKTGKRSTTTVMAPLPIAFEFVCREVGVDLTGLRISAGVQAN